MFSGSQHCLSIKSKQSIAASSPLALHQLWRRNWLLHCTRPSTHTAPAAETGSSYHCFKQLRSVGKVDIDARIRNKDACGIPTKISPEALATSGYREPSRTATPPQLEHTLSRGSAQYGTAILQARNAHSPSARSKSTPTKQNKRNLNVGHRYYKRSRWEETLRLLIKAVPRHKVVEGDSLWVSKKTLIMLSGTSGPNSWVHQVRGGCEIEVTEKQSVLHKARLVLLGGSTQTVALTKKLLLSLDDGSIPQQQDDTQGNTVADLSSLTTLSAASIPHDDLPNHDSTSLSTVNPHSIASTDFRSGISSSSELPIRSVISNRKVYSIDEKLLHLDQTFYREAYDVCSFFRLVEDLTTMEVPRLLRRELYGKQKKRLNIVVANALCHLFVDVSTVCFASDAALNRALTFLYRHNELFHQRNLLSNQSRRLRLKWQSRTYGHLLRAALYRGDMERFRGILEDMLFDGHAPDSTVWLALLKLVPSLEKKLVVIGWMKHKGFLEDTSLKSQVAAEFLTFELDALKHKKTMADQFFTTTDSHFGQDWMSQVSVTRALQSCRTIKAWKLALAIIDEAQKRNVVFEARAMPAILSILRQRGSVRDSLDFLRSPLVRRAGRNDDTLIPISFMTAWKHRFYNVCKVLWHYAASRGVITYQMQNVVTRSLLRNQQSSRCEVCRGGIRAASSEWWRSAGKVMVGVDPGSFPVERFYGPDSTPSNSSSTSPMMLLAQYAPDDGKRYQQLSVAYAMLRRDLEAWRWFAAPSTERLLQLLSDAYTKDVRWKRDGIQWARGFQLTQWMIENAIDVHLVKREISLEARTQPFNVDYIPITRVLV